MTDDIQARLDALQTDPRAWLWNADSLKKAADLVGSRFQGEVQTYMKSLGFGPETDQEAGDNAFRLGPSAMMLIGYAIEVLAKGLIVARDTAAGSSKALLRHLDHDLLNDAGIQLTADEAVLVEQLYHRVKWSGRYPTPRKSDAERFDAVASEAPSMIHNPGSLSTDDYRLACVLYDRMHLQLDDLLGG